MRDVWEALNRNVNFVTGIGWIVLTLPAYLWWQESIFYLICVSHYANWKTDISAHHAKRAEKEAQKEEG